MKAQAKAEKIATKEAKKQQSKLLKKNKKQSHIVLILYKKSSDSSTKAVSFIEEVEVVAEVEGSKMPLTRTQKINLPARFKI
jgi:hypothetical protein